MNCKIDISMNIEELSEKFAVLLKQCSDKSAKYFAVALSGGATPIAVFNYLAKNFKTKIDWNKIKFFWVDERCVPPDDPESNYGMTKINLFDHVAIPEQNIFRVRGEELPEKEVERYMQTIRDNVFFRNEFPRFDLIILGLGEDGHTASIFPEHLELFDMENFCSVAEHPITKQKRITLTGKVINNAGKIVFIVTGKSKSMISDKIINRKEGFEKYPASYVLPIDGGLIWMLDAEAAGMLNK